MPRGPCKFVPVKDQEIQHALSYKTDLRGFMNVYTHPEIRQDKWRARARYVWIRANDVTNYEHNKDDVYFHAERMKILRLYPRLGPQSTSRCVLRSNGAANILPFPIVPWAFPIPPVQVPNPQLAVQPAIIGQRMIAPRAVVHPLGSVLRPIMINQDNHDVMLDNKPPPRKPPDILNDVHSPATYEESDPDFDDGLLQPDDVPTDDEATETAETETADDECPQSEEETGDGDTDLQSDAPPEPLFTVDMNRVSMADIIQRLAMYNQP